MSDPHLDERVADLAATVDYINLITEDSDSFTMEQATTLATWMRRVAAAAKLAVDMLESQMLHRLEGSGPRQIDGAIYGRVREYTVRHDHEALLDAIVDHVANTDAEARLAARAVRETMDAFLSPSDKAKAGALKKLGVDRKAVEQRSFNRWKLSVTPIDPGASDDDE